MASSEGSVTSSKLPFSAKKMLVIFTSINILTYYDRGALAVRSDTEGAGLRCGCVRGGCDCHGGCRLYIADPRQGVLDTIKDKHHFDINDTEAGILGGVCLWLVPAPLTKVTCRRLHGGLRHSGRSATTAVPLVLQH